MKKSLPLFGYISGRTEDGSGLMISLETDGQLLFERRGQQAHFRVSDDCVRQVREIIRENRRRLEQYAREINRGHSPEHENCFVFDGILIADWDLTRWYLEEDRQKHPEYYDNTVKVTLTETYVRGIYDEICSVIEADNKIIHYARMIL